jgi:thioredoxin-like negative regulator of GroEL
VDRLDPSTIQEYSIMSIPRMILFENGKPVKDITGRTKYKILEEVNG